MSKYNCIHSVTIEVSGSIQNILREVDSLREDTNCSVHFRFNGVDFAIDRSAEFKMFSMVDNVLEHVFNQTKGKVWL